MSASQREAFRQRIKERRVQQQQKWRNMTPKERRNVREKLRQRRIERFQRR